MALHFTGSTAMYCYRVLKTLGENPEGLSTSQIDAKTTISFEHLRQALKPLQRNNYVTKSPSSWKGIYQITPEGRKLLETLDQLNS